MNIFEQYGGYEVVKQAISNYKQSGDMVTAAGLELQCLEYRRKNNIFEVEDKVVLLNWDNSEIYNIKSVYEHKIYDGNQHSYSTFVYLLDGWCYERWFNNRDIRLATDEEIEAGRRL